ncbi:adenine-specific methyltransferase EcoRI family protein [Caniella muris]|uniref:adenine-specific methyltransferase EcoRI family protein n=1 Tax=Caniella muris TaxID=2941502 RepID=UPI00203CCE1C|nr:adenine-specific methyltransferase EcoRI family protein [Caniella muris]
MRGRPYKAVVTKVYDATGDGGIGMLDVAELFRRRENELVELEGDGDFRSPECLGLLREADVVATNPPPFSLFRQYVSTLVELGKDFVIIGPDSGRKYRETFPLIRDDRMWLGATRPRRFYVPDSYRAKGVRVDDEGRRYMQMGKVCWYTNLDIGKRHEDLVLFRHYTPEAYPPYTNFDGIDVSSVRDIPCDYAGAMGVPVNFLDEYNPDQFEIVGLGEGNLAKEIGVTRNHEGRTKLEVRGEDGSYSLPYARIVVRNRRPETPKEA